MSEITFSGNTIGDKALYLKGVERGEKNERERIIKLLESEAETCEENYQEQPDEIWMHRGQQCRDAIALIKGENK